MHFKYMFLLFTYLIAGSLGVAAIVYESSIEVEKASSFSAKAESSVHVPEAPFLVVQKPSAIVLEETSDDHDMTTGTTEIVSTHTISNTTRITSSCTPTAVGGPAVSSIRLHLCQASLRFNRPTTTAFIGEPPSSTTVNSNSDALVTAEIKTPLPRRPRFPGATAEMEEQLLRDGKIVAIILLAHLWLLIYGWLIYWGQPRE